jgi:hypothetical protein
VSDDLSFPDDWKAPAPQLADDIPLDIRKVRRKPAEMQAVVATADNLAQIVVWVTSNGHGATLGVDQLTLQTYEGPFTIRIGDVVLRQSNGAFIREENELYDEGYIDLGPAGA